MMNKNDQEFLVQKIRTQYTVKEHTELDELKALDAKVKRPANVFAYTFGSIGAVVMGGGMSLIMTDLANTLGIENPMLYGIVIGIVGMAMTIINYPIYKKLLERGKARYAYEIVELARQISEED